MSNVTEIWKPIPGYENYFASSRGRLKYKLHILTQTRTSYGYQKLTHNSKRVLSHILVALAWHPNEEKKPFVNHKNGKKSDNRPKNLEWCTQSENQQHSLYVLNNSNGNKKKGVRVYKDGKLVTITKSVSQAAEFVGGQKTNVSHACMGQRKQHKGHTFKYVKYPTREPFTHPDVFKEM